MQINCNGYVCFSREIFVPIGSNQFSIDCLILTTPCSSGCFLLKEINGWRWDGLLMPWFWKKIGLGDIISMSKFNAWRSNGPPAVNIWLGVLIVNSGTESFCVLSEVFSYDQVTSLSCLGFEFVDMVNLQQFVEVRTSSVLPNHLFSNLRLHFQFAFKTSSYQLFHFFRILPKLNTVWFNCDNFFTSATFYTRVILENKIC